MLSPAERPRRAIQRAVRLVLSPETEWGVIAREAPDPWPLLGSFVVPLACIPAVAWSLDLALFGADSGQDGERAAMGLPQVFQGGLTVWGASILSVLVLASSIWILAPLFVRARDWPRVLNVAAYSAAPVFLGGVLLAIPDVAYAILLAVFQGCYLMYAGLQTVLGVKEENAAEFVALSIVMLSVATTAMGAVGSALGVL